MRLDHWGFSFVYLSLRWGQEGNLGFNTDPDLSLRSNIVISVSFCSLKSCCCTLCLGCLHFPPCLLVAPLFVVHCLWSWASWLGSWFWTTILTAAASVGLHYLCSVCLLSQNICEHLTSPSFCCLTVVGVQSGPAWYLFGVFQEGRGVWAFSTHAKHCTPSAQVFGHRIPPCPGLGPCPLTYQQSSSREIHKAPLYNPLWLGGLFPSMGTSTLPAVLHSVSSCSSPPWTES